MRKILTLIFLSLVFPSASVASPNFDQGVALFNSGQYAQAADLFEQELKTNPVDPLAHYYHGLCYHCRGQTPEAIREYNWVLAQSPDPELQKRARKGLQVLTGTAMAASNSRTAAIAQTKMVEPTASAAQSTASATQPTASATQPSASATQPTASATQPTASATQSTASVVQRAQSQLQSQFQPGAALHPQGPAPRVVDLYTDWCGWCRRFEPFFKQAQMKYGAQVNFERANGEAAENKAMVRKYRVRGYPTILFFNASGKLVGRIDGAPQSLEDFEQSIFEAFPSLQH